MHLCLSKANLWLQCSKNQSKWNEVNHKKKWGQGVPLKCSTFDIYSSQFLRVRERNCSPLVHVFCDKSLEFVSTCTNLSAFNIQLCETISTLTIFRFVFVLALFLKIDLSIKTRSLVPLLFVYTISVLQVMSVVHLNVYILCQL